MVCIALTTVIALAVTATAWPNLVRRQNGNDLVGRGATASQPNAINGVNNVAGAGNTAGGATGNGQTKGQKQRGQQQTQTGGAKTGGNTQDDTNSKNKGNGQGKQFITGLCASKADCQSGCCAQYNGKVVCKAPGALGVDASSEICNATS